MNIFSGALFCLLIGSVHCGWFPYTGGDFFVDFDSKVNQTVAAEKCAALNSTLAILKKNETQRFLASVLYKHAKKPYCFYIGITRIERRDVFKWGDGTQVTPEQAHWADKEPNNKHLKGTGIEDCVTMGRAPSKDDPTFPWYDISCARSCRYICGGEMPDNRTDVTTGSEVTSLQTTSPASVATVSQTDPLVTVRANFTRKPRRLRRPTTTPDITGSTQSAEQTSPQTTQPVTQSTQFTTQTTQATTQTTQSTTQSTQATTQSTQPTRATTQSTQSSTQLTATKQSTQQTQSTRQSTQSTTQSAQTTTKTTQPTQSPTQSTQPTQAPTQSTQKSTETTQVSQGATQDNSMTDSDQTSADAIGVEANSTAAGLASQHWDPGFVARGTIVGVVVGVTLLALIIILGIRCSKKSGQYV